MTRIADRKRNPFGMEPPCRHGHPVCGYGDPNADFHVIGDHPGIHGGMHSGIPFDGSDSGHRLREILRTVGLVVGNAETDFIPQNLFASYLIMCPPPDDAPPANTQYETYDQFFDAELRAVNAHILLPIGKRATDRILTKYTTQRQKVPELMADRHATEIRGRGFLVGPALEPATWSKQDESVYVKVLQKILASDYRQTKGVATLIG